MMYHDLSLRDIVYLAATDQISDDDLAHLGLDMLDIQLVCLDMLAIKHAGSTELVHWLSSHLTH
jgi:hypothetical protein